MQTISDDLKALLRSRFQVGPDGFRARIEVDIVTLADPPTMCGIYDLTPAGSYAPNNSLTTPANAIAYYVRPGVAQPSVPTPGFVGAWHFAALGSGGSPDYAGDCVTNRLLIMVVGPGTATINMATYGGSPRGLNWSLRYQSGGISTVIDSGSATTGDDIAVDVPDDGHCVHWVEITDDYVTCGGKWGYAGMTWAPTVPDPYDIATLSLSLGSGAKRIGIDKSLHYDADQAEIDVANEDLDLGWGASSTPTNSRLRIYQWYGDEADAVLTFTGVLDDIVHSRDPLNVTMQCRDMMAVLIDQTFSATAPQGADEDGADRTEDNGVYLNREISYIVNDLLDRAGYPTADRDITDTSYLMEEFIVEDGWSYAEAIAGDAGLARLVAYSLWADEAGVMHFGPTLAAGSFTDPPDPDYTYAVADETDDPLTSQHVISLRRETDQFALRTRVKVRGPLTTTTLTDTWRQVWKTGKFNKPVGLWYDPTDSANLRVLDRGTKKLYKLRQSDRAIIASVDVSGICAHPLGLSGDPADSSVYWILNAPWIDGGSGGNKAKKVRKSDNHVLLSLDLPDGTISAIKVSSSYLYFTRLDTDRFYQRDKTDGSAVDSWQHTYNSTSQTNPAGLMIDGTTISVFWTNGGTTARFLQCDESDPGTVTNVVKTAGTTLHGGEMDTTTHTECYGDSDSLGLVAKFTLLEAVDQTDEVYAEVVDTDLEDELGANAQLEDRTHDTHPGDADHPFEIRRETLDVDAIISLAQATETAQAMLDTLAARRQVFDVATTGNPALQKTDVIRVEDAKVGTARNWQIDTYVTEMEAGGSYLGTLALLPVETADDTPEDDGSAGS